MPTVIEVDGYKVLVYTNDHAPAHVHVRKNDAQLRVLIGDAAILWDVTCGSPNSKTVARMVELVAEHLDACNALWRMLYG